MSNLLSCQQSARLIGVSKSTVKRLCDQGELESSRTPGGHRRIAVSELRNWASQNGIQFRFDSGPMRTTYQPLTVRRILSLLEARQCKSLSDHIIAEVQKGNPLAEVLDERIAPALWEIGQQWEREELDPFEEHMRSRVITDTFTYLRHHIDQLLPTNSSVKNSRVAIGAAVGSELHHLASTMIELTLRHTGWRALSLGAILPVDSLINATQVYSPRLVWVSYTCLKNLDVLVEDNHRLFAALKPHQRLAIGGQALTSKIRRKLKFHFVGDSLCHLMSYAGSIEA